MFIVHKLIKGLKLKSVAETPWVILLLLMLRAATLIEGMSPLLYISPL